MPNNPRHIETIEEAAYFLLTLRLDKAPGWNDPRLMRALDTLRYALVEEGREGDLMRCAREWRREQEEDAVVDGFYDAT